jgi:hypothetical protein
MPNFLKRNLNVIKTIAIALIFKTLVFMVFFFKKTFVKANNYTTFATALLTK